MLWKSGTPFLGKRVWSWWRELCGIAGVHWHPQGQYPFFLPPSAFRTSLSGVGSPWQHGFLTQRLQKR